MLLIASIMLRGSSWERMTKYPFPSLGICFNPELLQLASGPWPGNRDWCKPYLCRRWQELGSCRRLAAFENPSWRKKLIRLHVMKFSYGRRYPPGLRGNMAALDSGAHCGSLSCMFWAPGDFRSRNPARPCDRVYTSSTATLLRSCRQL